MNAKQMKELRKKADTLQYEWVKSLMSEEESAKITFSNFWKYLPPQTHVHTLGRTKLSFMSYKWIVKMLKKHPSIETYQDMIEINNKTKNN